MTSTAIQDPGAAGLRGPLRALLLSLAALVLLLGISVIVGWHAHLQSLTRIRPDLAPMKYNTALAFVLSGLALGGLALRRREAGVAAGLTLFLGGATLAEFLLARDLGIDQAFFRDWDFVGMSQPGRMAPNTAFCLLIFGAAALLASLRFRIWRPLVLSLAAASLVVIGLISLIGYAAGVFALTAWGQFPTMAVHTGAGVTLLGLGLFAYAWEDGRGPGDPAPSWLPVPFSAGVLLGTLVVWQAIRTREGLQVRAVLRAEAATFREDVVLDLRSRLLSMDRMARRWELSRQAPTQEAWESDAGLNVSHHPGYQAVEWVDPAMRVRWVVPREGNEAVVGRDFSSDPLRRLPYDRALETGQPQVGPDLELIQGGRGFVICFPLRSLGRPNGFLVAVLRLDTWMKSLRKRRRQVHLQLSEPGGVFFRSGEPSPRGLEAAETFDFPFEGRTWRLHVAPSDDLIGQVYSHVAESVLASGALLSVLVGLLLRFAQEARVRARLLEEEVQERRKVEAVQSVILESSTVGIALVRSRTFLWANHRLAEMLGLAMEAILGASTRVIYPSDEVFEAMGARSYPALTGGGVVEDEIELVRADGSKFWCRFVGRAVDPERPKEDSVWMFEDVTERKRTDQMKREFVSTVSHELRTPITSIRGSLALLSAGVGGELPPDIRAMVDIALSNSVRLATLVNDILDMEKVGSGRLEIRPRPVDLADLARRALAQHQGYARPLGVSLRLDGEPAALQVRADEDRLMQVLGNLLSNAAKFSPAGSEVLLSLSRLERMGRIEVRDQGPGIPPAFEARIFQPFSQADAGDARSKGGTGLGLSISKALVEAMGGRIGHVSRPGAGAVFFVELPLASEEEPASGSHPADQG